MTNEELKEIEARAEAATPGPWECAGPMKKDKMEVTDASGKVCKTDLYAFEYPECWNNGEFIAHARTDIPKLCAEVRRLQNIIESLEAENDAVRGAAEEAYSHGYRIAKEGGPWI